MWCSKHSLTRFQFSSLALSCLCFQRFVYPKGSWPGLHGSGHPVMEFMDPWVQINYGSLHVHLVSFLKRDLWLSKKLKTIMLFPQPQMIFLLPLSGDIICSYSLRAGWCHFHSRIPGQNQIKLYPQLPSWFGWSSNENTFLFALQ